MAEVIKTTFQLRRGLSETWQRNNPVLAYGEPGFEKDTYKLKIGNGVTAWNDLGYLAGGSFDVSADEKSVTISNNVLALYGFAAAGVGQLASKGADGKLAWIDAPAALSDEEIMEVIGEDE